MHDFTLFYFLRLYLFIHERHRGEKEAETQAEGEAGSMQGLDPRTPGSRPEPKADAQRLSHPDVLHLVLRENQAHC